MKISKKELFAVMSMTVAADVLSTIYVLKNFSPVAASQIETSPIHSFLISSAGMKGFAIGGFVVEFVCIFLIVLGIGWLRKKTIRTNGGTSEICIVAMPLICALNNLTGVVNSLLVFHVLLLAFLALAHLFLSATDVRIQLR